MFGWFKNRRRKKILETAWPEEWSLHLNRNVRLTWGMTDQETSAIQKRIKVFVAEKNWEGTEGLQVSDEIKVTIAAQASMMLLGVEDFYFDNVKTILVFPHSFCRETSDGMLMGQSRRAGEAWQGGPIVLSWKDALKGGRDPDDGHNLVVHEFAHALDGLDGEMGGQVAFDDPDDTREWERIVDIEYERLCYAEQQGITTLLDHYGATNRAEFFAVASETYFEEPRAMQSEHTELFHLLSKYYRVNPIPWQTPKRNRKRRRSSG